jgi:sterol desaturase/sphingolipid hydroxylase (fatty acid hydroxylase superfamily)
VDLTVIAIPGYLGTMGAEYAWLKRQAAEHGPSAADYEWRDTLTSLAMGQISLVAPMLLSKALAPVTPGKGRYAKALVGAAFGAAAVVTVADLVAKRLDGALPEAGTLPDDRTIETDGADATGAASSTEAVASSTQAAGTGADDAGNRSRRRSLARLARKVSGSGAVTALAAAGVAAGAAWSARTAGKRLFDRHDRDLGAGPLAVAGAVLGWDMIYYWNHRMAHESRYLWAMHVVHHSSERYNLSTALRQPVVDALTMSLPYGALALLGFRPSVIETGRGINLLYQYWIHTETVPRLDRFEKVFNSQSLHRVHHGSNQRYLDRNHGSILIIWDRLFGTYQPEDEPVVYGLTRNIKTFNPVTVAFHEWRDMAGDVAGSRSWSDRVGFVFRGPGWAYARRAELAAEAISAPQEPSVPASSAA